MRSSRHQIRCWTHVQALGGALNGWPVSRVGSQPETASGSVDWVGPPRSQSSKAPNQRAVRIKFPAESGRPDSVWTFDGTTGWVKTKWSVPEHELVGHELTGSDLRRSWRFPANSSRPSPYGGSAPPRHSWSALQRRPGNGPRGLMVTLYFDQKSGLLSRMVRYGRSPVGNVLTQVDYADYRSVDGIQFVRVKVHLRRWAIDREAVRNQAERSG